MTAVVIRRGPAKSSALIGWDRRDDSFQLGQWMRGRIYEHRCDLSPDGKWFLYFVLNGKWNTETEGAFTAISMAPYLKAVTLFPEGSTWFGGGLFTSNNAYWLSHGFGRSPIREDHRLRRNTGHNEARLLTESSYSWGDNLYYGRLQRSGWIFKFETSAGGRIIGCEKTVPEGWTLRKVVHEGRPEQQGKGGMWEEHELEHTSSGLRIPGTDWEWADVDGTRVVWAEKGKLFAAHLNDAGLCDTKCLKDFNAMKFEAIAAPY